MKKIFIVNPAAGTGGGKKVMSSENVYLTKGTGDCTEFIRKTLDGADGEVNFIVCGGDGTVAEAAQALANRKNGVLTVCPTGTGNDFFKAIEAVPEQEFEADVMTVNGRAAVNAVNMGFDLEVVDRAAAFKKHKLLAGHTAYVLGVIAALFSRYGQYMKVEYVDKDGNAGCIEGELLLAVAGGGQYYGGGFKASPVADVRDGLIDLMVVKKVSRLKFISLVGKYKKGLHIDPETERPLPQFRDVMTFRRCKSVKVSGIRQVCCDGEIIPAECAEIGIMPKALRIRK